MTPAEYLAYLCSRLEVSDNEIQHKETELKATLRELGERREDPILLAERDRLVEALADLRARRKKLEEKLPGLGTIGGPSASQGAETAAGAGSLPAAPVSGGLGVRQTAGVAAGQSLGGIADAGYFADLFPSALNCMTFTLYDGVDVAMRLVSHARANGFRGEVRHVSTSRSNFTLLLKADDVGMQNLKGYASWLATQVPVLVSGTEASTAFAEAAEADAARVEVTSDPFNPLTRDRELLNMYNKGPLTVYAATEVQRALEKANTASVQQERLSKSSLGKSRASSSHAE